MKYNKLFWRTGQEITPETFIQSDNYICAQHNLIRQLIHRQYYGLLPVNDADTDMFSVNATLNGSEISIDQLCCNGITKEGYLISFDNDQLPSIAKQMPLSISKTPGIYFVVLRIAPFEQTLVEPVINEDVPLALPVYGLDIKESTNIEGNELPILKIDNSEANPAIDRNYIPPCMAVCSYQPLVDQFEELKETLNTILSMILKKKDQFQSLIYPVSFLLFDLEQFSKNASPGDLIQLLKKTVKTFEFFIKNASLNYAKAVNAPYCRDDIAPALQSLIKCFQDVQRFIGEVKQEKEFMPRI